MLPAKGCGAKAARQRWLWWVLLARLSLPSAPQNVPEEKKKKVPALAWPPAVCPWGSPFKWRGWRFPGSPGRVDELAGLQALDKVRGAGNRTGQSQVPILRLQPPWVPILQLKCSGVLRGGPADTECCELCKDRTPWKRQGQSCPGHEAAKWNCLWSKKEFCSSKRHFKKQCPAGLQNGHLSSDWTEYQSGLTARLNEHCSYQYRKTHFTDSKMSAL